MGFPIKLTEDVEVIFNKNKNLTINSKTVKHSSFYNPNKPQYFKKHIEN